jgi:hypothetical protein
MTYRAVLIVTELLFVPTFQLREPRLTTDFLLGLFTSSGEREFRRSTEWRKKTYFPSNMIQKQIQYSIQVEEKSLQLLEQKLPPNRGLTRFSTLLLGTFPNPEQL